MTIEDKNINLTKEEGETPENTGDGTTKNTGDEVVVVEETRGVVVERLVNDEYKVWKSQTPFLYDMVICHASEWPSLTVEWLPDRIDSSEYPYSVGEIILGTYATDNEANYLYIAQVKFHLLDDYLCDKEYGNCEDNNSQLMIQTQQQIPHDGQVHRARHMPQDPSIIATKTNDSKVCIFDRKNHSAKPPIGGKSKSNPDLRLTGHDFEGFGLSWCKLRKGLLLSGSYDSKVCLWDINQTPQNKAIDALQIFEVDNGPVEDVEWHWKHYYLFASCSADRYLRIYDLRSENTCRPSQRVMAHKSEVTCLSFNPFNEWLVATGSTDTNVKLFDLRKFVAPVHTFKSHRDSVIQVGWSPHSEIILASSCTGRRLMVWDASRIGDLQMPEDAEDGPPELLFIHGGHTDKVPDFAWNPNEEWLIASVADDNMVQVWKMGDHIYND